MSLQPREAQFMAALQIGPAHPEDALEVAALHVSAWRVAYAGILPEKYLAQLSVEARAALWRESILRGTPALCLAREVMPAADGQLNFEPVGRSPALGFASYGPCRDEDLPATWGEIWAIYVLPAHWSHGIGRALWRYACAELRRDGYQHVSLWVLADNERAIRFYRRAGLEPDAGVTQTIERGGRSLTEVRYRAAL
jgi:ribosomal protein S18 acetylase RimI-like enzyme